MIKKLNCFLSVMGAVCLFSGAASATRYRYVHQRPVLPDSFVDLFSTREPKRSKKRVFDGYNEARGFIEKNYKVYLGGPNSNSIVGMRKQGAKVIKVNLEPVTPKKGEKGTRFAVITENYTNVFGRKFNI